MDHLLTEARNPASTNLDELTPLDLVRLMCAEDAQVPVAVAAQAEPIAQAIDAIAARLQLGGRLIYAGAGTSGRLGVLDATECPPTFNSPPGQVVGIIAGGPRALTQAVEGAEDHPEFAQKDLQALGLNANDVVVGIATSGRTPYVLGAVDYAKAVGAFTIGFSCNPDSDLSGRVDLAITVPAGPEVLSGSTRLKAGTATKLVLNMLSTGAMVRLGKTYGNLMVDLRATNEKLRARTNRIVRQLTGLDQEAADALLQNCDGELKTALVAQLGQTTPDDARARLSASSGRVGQTLESLRSATATTHPGLVLGIDGGGTHTIALLAQVSTRARSASKGDETLARRASEGTLLGRGESGPSNIQAVGPAGALAALDQAVQAAFAEAKLPRGTVGAACLGLAGADRAADRDLILEWAKRVRLTDKVEVTNDAALLLAARYPLTPGPSPPQGRGENLAGEGWGLAVIAGTGSFAYAKTRNGTTSRSGGWGYLLGDEGSGYAIAVAGLQAVARAADGRGPATLLKERLLQELELAQPQELIPKIYRGGMDRPALAALAPLVIQAAATDQVARSIVSKAAQELAETAAVLAKRLFTEKFPLVLAGGLFVGELRYREAFLEALAAQGIAFEPVAVVTEPAQGGVRLAMSMLPLA
ncbi:MAG: N-acetylmuramic acid 6-phosphate etherase [Gemmataceae bacterium]|nr:N-acetylmuramic acid 6-phosphate etherase [Gemmataceae bacterium]MCI0738041.1 N-acetylmuramic acid 6-phosphate etherase [Gemmataceae bacterium]